MTRRKLRRLYMVEAQWPDGQTMSRSYQDKRAAWNRAEVWSSAKYRLGAAESVSVVESLPVVWGDES